jgi:hypothetical protein
MPAPAHRYTPSHAKPRAPRQTLRRAGTVSAGTLALVLSGGGMAFAGLLPSPTDAALGTVTSTTTSTLSSATGTSTSTSPTDPVTAVVDTLTGAVTGSSTPSPTPTAAPSPAPLPEPLNSAVNSVVGAVSGVLAPVTNQLPPGTVPTSPLPGSGATPSGSSHTGTPPLAPVGQLPAKYAAASAGGATPVLAGAASTYGLTNWTAPSAADLGFAPRVASAPMRPAEQAQLAAGITPQVAGNDRIGIPHDGSTGGLPGILIIAATIAVGVVAAGHVALFQQRLATLPAAH